MLYNLTHALIKSAPGIELDLHTNLKLTHKNGETSNQLLTYWNQCNATLQFCQAT